MCQRMGDKLYKNLRVCSLGEGFRGSRSEACWDIPSEGMNKLSSLILLIAKKHTCSMGPLDFRGSICHIENTIPIH